MAVPTPVPRPRKPATASVHTALVSLWLRVRFGAACLLLCVAAVAACAIILGGTVGERGSLGIAVTLIWLCGPVAATVTLRRDAQKERGLSDVERRLVGVAALAGLLPPFVTVAVWIVDSL